MKVNTAFLNDVREGLSIEPKRLSSKYFYDDNGDKLFHYIMNQPEYYLTCAEHEILQTHGESIFSHIVTDNCLRIIEPGAGDGLKTRILIEILLSIGYDCIYNPVDISANVLEILCNSLNKIYPQLQYQPIVGDYENLAGTLVNDDRPRLMLFLGSNLGNYDQPEAINLLKTFSNYLNTGDYFLLGVDLVKDPEIILNAYDDKEGYTALFNYNLLLRINKELGANFNVGNFKHYPIYNPLKQQAESYLVSQKEQTITFSTTGDKFHFKKWEIIHTEISRKFTPEKLNYLSQNSGYKIVDNYFDVRNYFCCSLWKKV